MPWLAEEDDFPHAASHWGAVPSEGDPASRTGVIASRQMSLDLGRWGMDKRCPGNKCTGWSSVLCLAARPGLCCCLFGCTLRIQLASAAGSVVVLARAVCPCCCSLCSFSWSHLINCTPRFPGSSRSLATLLES